MIELFEMKCKFNDMSIDESITPYVRIPITNDAEAAELLEQFRDKFQGKSYVARKIMNNHVEGKSCDMVILEETD